MERKGLTSQPLKSGTLELTNIPKLQDFFTEAFIQFIKEEEQKRLCQFCEIQASNQNFLGCQNCFNLFGQFE